MARTVKKPEERRREIVAAAQKLFQEQGYDDTTMQDLMREVGISKGAVYHYFRSKDELLDAVVEQSVDDYVQAMRAVLDETEGSGLDKLLALIGAGNVSEEQGELLEALHRPGNTGMHTRQVAQLVSRLAPLYAEAIQQGRDEGAFDTPHPLESAELLLAGIQLLTDPGFHPWSPDDLARRSRAIPALIEAQLGAPAGTLAMLSDRF